MIDLVTDLISGQGAANRKTVLGVNEAQNVIKCLMFLTETRKLTASRSEGQETSLQINASK
jgi:hypothetical protein